jgi:hypothetical protein
MIPRTRRERIALALWVLLATFIGNGIYDVLVARGIKEFLFRHALSEAGAGPAVPLAPLMHTTVLRATGVGVLWAVLVLMVGFATIRLVRPSGRD